jgi:hypothetical protein
MRRGEQPVQGSSGRREAARLRLGIADEILSYAIELGYRAYDHTSAFVLDPEIKREWIWAGGPFHPRSLLVQRTGAVVERCEEGGPQSADRPGGLAPRESVHRGLRSARSPGGVSAAAHDPELALLRQLLHRSPGSCPQRPHRHPHPFAGRRRRRSGGGGAAASTPISWPPWRD